MAMKKCVVCNKYTMEEIHCKKPTKTPHPPKFKIKDPYAKYRRKMKGIE
jgi:rRNA maturation protein Nop10